MTQVEDMILYSTKLSIVAITTSCPDAGFPHSPRFDFDARIESGALLVLSPLAAPVTAELSRDDFASLVEMGHAAIAAGGGYSGFDTAIGRDITTIELQLIETHLTPDQPTRAVYSLNHCAPSSRGPAPWATLLQGIAKHCLETELNARIHDYTGWFGG